MDDEAMRQRDRDMEQVRREMYRKSMDTLRIYNPLDVDFSFYWDGYPNVIKSHQTKDVERYKATKYFKDVSQFIIGQLARAKGEKLLEKRLKDGLPQYLDKYVENIEVWDKTPRMDDRELLEQIADQVILGLVEEYGLELPEVKRSGANPKPDLRGLHDQIIALLDRKIADDEPAEHTPDALPIKEKLAL